MSAAIRASFSHNNAGSGAEFCLFICAPFRDMEAERAYLTTHVFPVVRDLCNKRGIGFTEIDPRWGGSRDEAGGGNTIGRCLDELVKYRPVFLGILGARHGRVLHPADIVAEPALIRRYPDLRRAVEEGQSLTEMEIRLGVLQRLEAMRGNAFFYFREGSAGHTSTDEDARQQTRLRTLVTDIQQSGLPVRKEFGSPEVLGKWVLQDLLSIINRRFPCESVNIPLEREQQAHDAYALSRRHAYVERTAAIRRLDEHVAAGDPVPLIVSGESGSGKSALLAYWCARYEAQHRRAANVVAHYVGATPASSDHVVLLRRIMTEIQRRYNVGVAIPDDADELVQRFPEWLGFVQGAPLVLVIDALDHLDRASRSLSWLPRFIQPNVRLIVSTTDPDAFIAAHDGENSLLQLPPLTSTEQKRIVREFLRLHGRPIADEYLGKMTRAPLRANALFLRVSLEMLHVYEMQKGVGDDAQKLINATNLDELYARVLGGYEKAFGQNVVRDVMKRIWASHSGLTREELGEMIGQLHPRCDSEAMFAVLGVHMRQHNGRITFFHESFRKAVERRYLRGSMVKRRTHQKLARYFLAHTSAARRAEEAPWQLLHGQLWRELGECLGSVETFTYFWNDATKYQFLEFARRATLEAPEVPIGRLLAPSRGMQSGNPLQAATLFRRLGEFLLLRGDRRGARTMYRRAGRLFEKSGPINAGERAALHCDSGMLHRLCGAFADAERELRSGLKLLDSHTQPLSELRHRLLSELAVLAYHNADNGEAERILVAVHDAKIAAYGRRHPEVARTLISLGAIYHAMRRLDEALDCLVQAQEMLRETYGDTHPELATCLNNMGAVYRETDVDMAVERFTAALEMNQRIFGTDHQGIAAQMINLAMLMRETHRYQQSHELYDTAIRSDTRFFGTRYPRIATALIGLATLQRSTGDLKGARRSLQRALDITRRAFEPDHFETSSCELNMASLLKELRDFKRALPLYRHALPIRVHALGYDHARARAAVNGYIDLLVRLGSDPDRDPLLVRLRKKKRKGDA